jgi:hypothetical protein
MCVFRSTLLSAIVVTVVANLVVVVPVSAQEPVTVAELKTPGSPGFVVLGVEPTAIQRPTSPRAVGLSLVSAVADGDSVIPKNYALEIAPFWLKSQPDLTYADWNTANVAQTMLQSLALSVATTSISATGDQAAASGIGVGVRTLLLRGNETSKAVAIRGEITALQTKMLLADTEAAENEIAVQLREQALMLQTENKQRTGWVLEVAAAVAAKVQDEDFDGGQLTRYGFWATPGYQLDTRAVTFLGVVRYQRDQVATDMDLFDVGARLQVDVQDFALSTEVVRRLLDESTDAEMDSTRVVGVMDYRINDSLYLTATFGKDYKDMMTGKSGLVSFLGMNFGLSKKPTVALE